MSLRIQEMPEEERPRERLLSFGATALSSAELIAILLRTGVKGCGAVPLAAKLISDFGSLNALARAHPREIAKQHGLGNAKAAQLSAAFALADRIARSRASSQPVENPAAVYALVGAELSRLDHEVVRVILLDARHRLLGIEDVSRGSVNETTAHPRQIFLPAIRHSAYGMIVTHNHPSGDPSPSKADESLTVRLREGAKLLGILLFDHIICGRSEDGRPPYFSFKEAGVL